MKKNQKIIHIPFFERNEDVILRVEEIRKEYLNEYVIIGSELSKQEKEYFENGLAKKGYYISGVDIILEKRKDDIKVLLFEDTKVIEDKNTNDIADKIEETINDEIFPNINYEYWMNKNPYYSNFPLLPTMKICIVNYASKPGLINDVLKNIDTISCKTLVSLIESDIISIINNNQFHHKDKMLRVFDLINGWGGKMGKATYVKPKGNTTRNSVEAWFEHYINGVKKAITGDKEGLNDFTKIPNVGDSFGTKHLYFWSLFGCDNPIPIYDARIKTLLYLSTDAAPSFEEYVEDMKRFSKQKNMTINQLEKALFAFSSNFFPNESLNIKNEILDKTDIHVAKRLENLYNSNN
jgi:hypothetical protein